MLLLGVMVTDAVLHVLGEALALPVLDRLTLVVGEVLAVRAVEWLPTVVALPDSVPVVEREPLPLALCVGHCVGLCVGLCEAVPQAVTEGDRLELCEGEVVAVPQALALPHSVLEGEAEGQALTDCVLISVNEGVPLTLTVLQEECVVERLEQLLGEAVVDVEVEAVCEAELQCVPLSVGL
jgi:hypothetical protein